MKLIVLIMGLFVLTGIGLADAPVEAMADAVAASPSPVVDVPAPPQELPWWGQMAKQLLGEFPEINGWLVFGFLILSTLIGAAEAVLKAIADKTGNETASKWLTPIGKVSLWLAKLLEWTNKPKLLPKDKESET